MTEDESLEIQLESERYYRNSKYYYDDDDELDLDGLSLSSNSGKRDA